MLQLKWLSIILGSGGKLQMIRGRAFQGNL